MATINTRTIKPSGGDYTSLAAWEAGRQGQLVTDNRCEIAECYAMSDTGGLLFGGWTTDATHWIKVIVAAGEGHSGIWDASKYNLSGTGTAHTITTANGWLTLDGLQANITGGYYGIYPLNAEKDIVSNCIIKGTASESRIRGIYITGSENIYIYNTIVYGITTQSGDSRCIFMLGSGTAYIYNTTLIGSPYGILHSNGTVIAKNVYAGGQGTSCFSGTITKITCGSSDATGSEGLQNISVNTDQFINVTPGSEDFHLAAASALKDVGTDTSGDPAPMDFTTDIDGETRSGSWDIGADEVVDTGATLVVSECSHAHVADAPVLVGHKTLVVSGANHAQSADAPVLTQIHTLAVQKTEHGHVIDPIILAQAHLLAVSDGGHLHAADNVILEVGATLLAVQDAAHAHASDAILLSQIHNLNVHEVAHLFSSDGISLSQWHLLAVNGAEHLFTSDEPTIFFPEKTFVDPMFWASKHRGPKRIQKLTSTGIPGAKRKVRTRIGERI